MSRVLLQPAYLLHQRAFRESSRIIEFLTPDYGRVGLVGRGVRRDSSRWRAALQPFGALRISWSGRGELGTLTAVEPDDTLGRLPPQVLVSAFYLNELLLRLLERQDPHSGVFEAYAEALAALRMRRGVARGLRLFEKRLLDALGYGLALERDAESGAPVRAGAAYEYRLESGPVEIAEGARGRLAISGESLLSLARGELADRRSLAESRRLLAAALALYLGEPPLNSRNVARAMRR